MDPRRGGAAIRAVSRRSGHARRDHNPVRTWFYLFNGDVAKVREMKIKIAPDSATRVHIGHPAGTRTFTRSSPEPEIYSLLAVYQVVRIAIADATAVVRADPDRASFTSAVQTARDLIVQAANVIAGTTIDLIGTVGRHLLNTLMPTRRLRISPRAVKRPLSRYAYKSLGIDRKSYLATLNIDILAGQPALTNQDDP
jgi:hypothetical protein